MRTAQQAVVAARRSSRNRDDMCLFHVQTWLGSPWSGPYAMWAWENAKHKHRDKNAPPGAPVYWSSPRHKYGHVALSVGGGRVRSTDWPRDTFVGETSIDTMSRSWGITYQGWTEDIAGQRIPGLTDTEDDMPLTDADVQKIANAVWGVKTTTGWQKDGTYAKDKGRKVSMRDALIHSQAAAERFLRGDGFAAKIRKALRG